MFCWFCGWVGVVVLSGSGGSGLFVLCCWCDIEVLGEPLVSLFGFVVWIRFAGG